MKSLINCLCVLFLVANALLLGYQVARNQDAILGFAARVDPEPVPVSKVEATTPEEAEILRPRRDSLRPTYIRRNPSPDSVPLDTPLEPARKPSQSGTLLPSAVDRADRESSRPVDADEMVPMTRLGDPTGAVTWKKMPRNLVESKPVPPMEQNP